MFVKDGKLFLAKFRKVDDSGEDFLDSLTLGFDQISDGKVHDADLRHENHPDFSGIRDRITVVCETS